MGLGNCKEWAVPHPASTRVLQLNWKTVFLKLVYLVELVHKLEAEFHKYEGFSSGFRQKFTSILIRLSLFHTSVLRPSGASAAS